MKNKKSQKLLLWVVLIRRTQSNENNRTRLGIDRIISIHIFNVVVKHFHFALHATCLFWSVGLNRGRIVAQHCRRDVHCPVELAFQ